MRQMQETTTEPTRRGAGLAGRLLVAQALVLLAGALTAWTIASTVGPQLFHAHLARASIGSTTAQSLHTEEVRLIAGHLLVIPQRASVKRPE